MFRHGLYIHTISDIRDTTLLKKNTKKSISKYSRYLNFKFVKFLAKC